MIGTNISVRPLKIPFVLRPFLERQPTEMEKHGKLEHSTSSYRAPLVMVKKKRGDIRV